MKKVMISQPMAERSEEEIILTRVRAIKVLRENKEYEVVNTLFFGAMSCSINAAHEPIYYLAKSLEYMSMCDVVYFCKGWENARGCKIEHDVAVAYGLKILYEDM